MSLTSRAPWFWSLRKDLSPWKESWATKNCCFLNCGVGEDSWEVPCTARRSNQSVLKEISPQYSLEGLMLKLKLQYFGHLGRTDSLEKTLMLGKIAGGRRGWQRMRWLDGITNWLMSRNDTGNNCPGVRRISVISWWQSQRWSQNPCGPLPTLLTGGVS